MDTGRCASPPHDLSEFLLPVAGGERAELRVCLPPAGLISDAGVLYTIKLYAYFFHANVPTVVVANRWLTGFALPLLLIALTLVYSYAVIRFGRWLFGRKNL